ncbi:RimK family alpha-L-glutamate ligase [Candidatus Uhrbacteria bacterium]|nr:RimK family alpha-L-glutamate ligase [Candidatus Uhrbacteria bacterium]
MNIGILISSAPRDERFTNIERLEEAAHQRGHDVTRLYEPHLAFRHAEGLLSVRHERTDLGPLDVIIYRPNFVEEPGVHVHNVELLQRAGYRVLNGHAGDLAASKNKLAQHVRFMDANLPTARWAIARDPNAVREEADRIGYPIIIKTAFGTHGIGVFYAERPETLLPLADYLNVRDRNPVILEEFVANADRKDLRVFVVGGNIIAAMERNARPGDVRANAALGGESQTVDLTEGERDLALKTANAFNLEILGIDILRSNRRPLVIEINSNPGFDAIENVTGVDVAGAIIDYALHEHPTHE